VADPEDFIHQLHDRLGNRQPKHGDFAPEAVAPGEFNDIAYPANQGPARERLPWDGPAADPIG
jgi:hypothetical protein